jgi:hypothetical protein
MMLKRRPQGSGAVQLGGQPVHTRNHPKLQAHPTMAQRLDLLLWSRKVAGAGYGQDVLIGRIVALDLLKEEIAQQAEAATLVAPSERGGET